MRRSSVAWTGAAALGCALFSQPAWAGQAAQAPSPGWRFVQDGVVHVVYNNQGGPRGGDEGVVPNWWMGMATRPVGKTSAWPQRDAQPGRRNRGPRRSW